MRDFLSRAAQRYSADWPGPFALSRTVGYFPIMIRGQHFRCDPDHRGIWAWIGSGNWEPETFEVLDR